MIVWIALNIFAVSLQWDPYPFILLNLAFSTQAAYAAPLILLAQNRQENRDKVSLEEDRIRAEQTKADTEFLARELAALRISSAKSQLATICDANSTRSSCSSPPITNRLPRRSSANQVLEKRVTIAEILS